MSKLSVLDTGVNYVEMHKLAERTMLGELKQLGLVTGEVEEMMKVRLGAVFMPHGLGHFMGIDTHDVGGYPEASPRQIHTSIIYSMSLWLCDIGGGMITFFSGTLCNRKSPILHSMINDRFKIVLADFV